jgi:hypothetical protein
MPYRVSAVIWSAAGALPLPGVLLTGDGPCPVRIHCHALAVRLSGAHSDIDAAMTAVMRDRGRMTVAGSVPGT